MKPVDRRPMNPKRIIIESSQEFFHVDIPPPPSAGLSQSLIDRRPPLLYLHQLYRRGSSWRRSPASIILFFLHNSANDSVLINSFDLVFLINLFLRIHVTV